MPPKSVIQDDIRMKLGRFELVKKKGRSEVWNLFGQVRCLKQLQEILPAKFSLDLSSVYECSGRVMLLRSKIYVPNDLW